MRNHFSTAIALCAAAALFAGCCHRNESRPRFAVIEHSETMRADGGVFDLDYRMEYLSWHPDPEAGALITTAMLADFFGEDYLAADPLQTAENFDRAVTGDYGTRSSGGYPWSGYIKIRSHKDILNDRIVAYTIERSEYMGGAHGMETVEYANYDLRTGKRLTLADVFTPEGYAALADRIREAILENHRIGSWEELCERTCFVAEDEIGPTENFLLGNGHITFLYNPYDIACYAQGRTKVRLPLGGLGGFRKDIME